MTRATLKVALWSPNISHWRSSSIKKVSIFFLFFFNSPADGEKYYHTPTYFHTKVHVHLVCVCIHRAFAYGRGCAFEPEHLSPKELPDRGVNLTPLELHSRGPPIRRYSYIGRYSDKKRSESLGATGDCAHYLALIRQLSPMRGSCSSGSPPPKWERATVPRPERESHDITPHRSTRYHITRHHTTRDPYVQAQVHKPAPPVV